VLLVLVLAAAFGVGLFVWLGTLVNTATLGGKVTDPTQSSALVNLPGTVVVAQSGSLFVLRGGHFTRIASGGWTQPAVTPDHRHLVAVRRQANFSDLYELSTTGAVERQLTNDASNQVDLNHWSFYPSVSPDGANVYYSYDRKYFPGSFLVDLAVYRMPLAGSQRQAQAWSTPNQGTGGDLQATGLASGGLARPTRSSRRSGTSGGSVPVALRFRRAASGASSRRSPRTAPWWRWSVPPWEARPPSSRSRRWTLPVSRWAPRLCSRPACRRHRRGLPTARACCTSRRRAARTGRRASSRCSP
jgi:hypothetical protein